MSPSDLELLEGALFISDAHYSDRRPELLAFLRDIENGVIQTPQLVLMGDIFDMLFGPIALTHERNREAITCINAIAEMIEVWYLEGNHDFRLQKIFPRVKVFPLNRQPLHVSFKTQKLWLAHGDYGNRLSYKIYTALIRSEWVLRLLGMIDLRTSHGVIRKLDRYLAQKEDCRVIEGFETLVAQRLESMPTEQINMLIEGHFHQNRRFTCKNFEYINLGAFACNERYYAVKSFLDAMMLQEHRY